MCNFLASSRKSAALRGGVLLYAAQAIPPIDADLSRTKRGIAKKGHLWTEASDINTVHNISIVYCIYPYKNRANLQSGIRIEGKMDTILNQFFPSRENASGSLDALTKFQ